MITHEQAYKAHCNSIIGQTSDEVDENHEIVKKYMKQQEKKDELLKLYRQYIHVDVKLSKNVLYDKNYLEIDKNRIYKQIKQLLEELEND
jgi:hypothetical protein